MDSKIFTNQNKYLILALDHRTSLEKTFVKPEVIINFKSQIIQSLTDQFTGLMIDPQYGLPAYKKALEINPNLKNKPLLFCTEKSGYQDQEGERLTQIEHQVSDLKKLGAQAIKLLLYINPQAKTINQQIDLTKQILTDCQTNNLPLFLELITYQLNNKPKKNLIPQSIKILLEKNIKPNVFKLEYPENNAGCQETTKILKQENIPWVLLSRGASFETYQQRLQIAIQSGAQGMMVGRALWQEATKLKGEEQTNFFNQTLKQRFQILSNIVLEK